MRVEQRAPWNLTSVEVWQCQQLSFSHGMMKPTLSCAIADRKGRVFFIKNDHNQIIAWAIVVPQEVVRPLWQTTYSDRPTAMFYTREDCRRKGYGSQILRVVRRRYVKIGTYSHAPSAEAFFGGKNKKARVVKKQQTRSTK